MLLCEESKPGVAPLFLQQSMSQNPDQRGIPKCSFVYICINKKRAWKQFFQALSGE